MPLHSILLLGTLRQVRLLLLDKSHGGANITNKFNKQQS